MWKYLPSSLSYMKRTDVGKNIFHKLYSDVIGFSRVGKVMIMGDLNAHIIIRCIIILQMNLQII